MEHRCGERVPMELPALVHTARCAVLDVTIGNMSREGAFVSIPADRATLRGLVELELNLPAEANEQCRWRAYVIHQRPDGVGLIFDDRRSAARLPMMAACQAVQRGVGEKRGLRAGLSR